MNNTSGIKSHMIDYRSGPRPIVSVARGNAPEIESSNEVNLAFSQIARIHLRSWGVAPGYGEKMAIGHVLPRTVVFLAMICVPSTRAADPAFESQLFEKGELVYSDDFDGDFNRERWGAPTKDKQIKDGKLVVVPKFKSKEEAMKALKRDHHLGLEPVVHLNKIPEQFVCHMRYKFEKPELTPGRPSFQIGHHMIVLGYLEGGGHRIKLPDGPAFSDAKSGMKLSEWVDLIIEYKLGKIRISVNGHSKTYEHEKVTIINEKRQTRTKVFSQGRSGLPNRL